MPASYVDRVRKLPRADLEAALIREAELRGALHAAVTDLLEVRFDFPTDLTPASVGWDRAWKRASRLVGW